ncbi:hypothetical protein RPALISO_38 [Ruegeria phage RpAliso]|nr:hypothetical protein RPALISO_38 [Ruegeria phage RpAliso]
MQGVEHRSAAPMRQREQIEGDLIEVTARLHDLAIGGISAENQREMESLVESMIHLTSEADGYVPSLVHTITEKEPVG